MPLPIAIAGVIAVLKVIRGVISTPLINKAIDNLVAGTKTRVDDAVWAAVESVCGTGGPVLPDEAKPQLEEALGKVQTWYDELSPDEKAFAKEPIVLADAGEPRNENAC